MAMKTKLIGLLIILLGAWPFLLKIEAIGVLFESYKFLDVLTPGEVVYQIVVIVLGALLLWTFRPRVAVEARR